MIVISDSFAEIYRTSRGVPAERIHTIPNWIRDEFGGDGLVENCRAALNIPSDAFVFLYGGNIGAAAGVETALQAFTSLREDAYLLIAGAGSHLAACEQLAAGNDRVKFHTPWQKEDTQRVLAAGDIFLLPTVGQQSLASVPSKLITYMLAGRPVLALALPDTETAQVIQSAGCGWVIAPDDPDLLAQTMVKLIQLPSEELAAMGAAGRAYALQHLTDTVCLPQVMAVITQAAKRTA